MSRGSAEQKWNVYTILIGLTAANKLILYYSK